MKALLLPLLCCLALSACSLERFDCPEYPMFTESKRVPPYYPHCFLPEGSGGGDGE